MAQVLRALVEAREVLQQTVHKVRRVLEVEEVEETLFFQVGEVVTVASGHIMQVQVQVRVEVEVELDKESVQITSGATEVSLAVEQEALMGGAAKE